VANAGTTARDTLSRTDNFTTDGGLLVPDVGSWQLSDGRYTGTPEAGSNTAESLAQLVIHPAYMLQLETTLKAQSTGGVLFDQYSPTDFKYAALSLSTGQVVIGHYTERNGWVVDAYSTQALSSNTDYLLGVTLQGNVVTVTLGGQVVLTKVYNALVVDGSYGLLSVNGTSSFDQLTVKTNDPAYGGPIEIDDPPTVAITSSANGATSAVTLFNITANASDDIGVARVEFFINGVSIGVDSNGADGWSVIWDSTGMANGVYTLCATVTDTKGQTSSYSIQRHGEQRGPGRAEYGCQRSERNHH